MVCGLHAWLATELSRNSGLMTTRLTQPLRREIEIEGEPYTVVLTRQGVRLSRKRFREGRVVSWRALWELGAPERREPVLQG